MASATALYADESIETVNKYFTKRKAYVGTDGKFASSVNTDTAALVMYNLTG